MPDLCRCRGLVSLVVLAFGLSSAVQAQGDVFMKECTVSASAKTCECMAGKIPPDKRAAALDGMRRSNASMAPGANPIDPAQMTQEQMQGLDAVVSAQASCM